jgi:hypothetical protein
MQWTADLGTPPVMSPQARHAHPARHDISPPEIIEGAAPHHRRRSLVVTTNPVDAAVRDLHARLLDAWNRREAEAYAAGRPGLAQQHTAELRELLASAQPGG